MRRLLVDSGPLVAWIDRRDRHHGRAVAFFRNCTGEMVTTWPVLTEVCHLVPAHARVPFLKWAAQALAIVPLPDDAASGLAGLIERYPERPMDLADASLLWLADEAGIFDIATVDRAGFDTYRTAAQRALRNCFFG